MHACDPINVNVAQRTYQRLCIGVPIWGKDGHNFFLVFLGYVNF